MKGGEKMMEKKWGLWILVIGGLNWGLIAIGYFLNTNLNVVNLVLGGWPLVENLVYLLVGICAVTVAYMEMQKK